MAAASSAEKVDILEAELTMGALASHLVGQDHDTIGISVDAKGTWRPVCWTKGAGFLAGGLGARQLELRRHVQPRD